MTQSMTVPPAWHAPRQCQRFLLGVTTSDHVAPGTPRLGRPDAERFDEAFEKVRALARQRIAAPWRTVAPRDEPPATEVP